MSSCRHLLNLKIQEILTRECQTNIDTDDPTRVDTVAIRKYPKSPTVDLVIMNFDPIELSRFHDITVGNDRAAQDRVGIRLPPGEIGGGRFEIVMGVVEIIAFPKGEEGTKADEIIQEVASRVKWALREFGQREITGQITDSYGETVIMFTVVGTMEYDSGASSTHITRTFVQWVANTVADPTPVPLAG